MSARSSLFSESLRIDLGGESHERGRLRPIEYEAAAPVHF